MAARAPCRRRRSRGPAWCSGWTGSSRSRDAFKSYPADHIGSIATLRVFGEGSGLTPGAKTLSFVQNHDTERNGDALSYKDGATNIIANEFLLAYGYGRPQVYSGFAWNIPDDSPPATADGLITDTDCSAATWVCVVNDLGVRNMVGWHNTVGSAPVRNWWDDGGNLISFSRGAKGWIAINNDPTAHTQTFRPACPRACTATSSTARAPEACSGPTVHGQRPGPGDHDGRRQGRGGLHGGRPSALTTARPTAACPSVHGQAAATESAITAGKGSAATQPRHTPALGLRRFLVCTRRCSDRLPRAAGGRLAGRAGQLRALPAAASAHRLVAGRTSSPPNPSVPAGQRSVERWPGRPRSPARGPRSPGRSHPAGACRQTRSPVAGWQRWPRHASLS